MSKLGKSLQQLSPEKKAAIIDAYRRRRPQTDTQLWAYINLFFNLRIPRKAICEGHVAPFDYLSNSFFGRHDSCVCWANRSGGKTQMGAIAAMLDSIHNPYCGTRILGGSLEQSTRMYEHCDVAWDTFRDYLDGEPTQRRTRLLNRSTIEIMAASAKSVRGPHVPKLKLDEIDEIDKVIYEAAIPIAQSLHGIPATIEKFSTMHKVGGRMTAVIDKQEDTLYKWCLWETIEQCRDRTCSQCILWGDCRGKAKDADGYILVKDAIRWLRNVSRASWECEILCERPSPEGAIYPEFDTRINVKEFGHDENLPVYRAIDWGYNFFACLYIQEDKDGNIRVIDEYKGEQKPLPHNIEAMRAKEKPFANRIVSTYVDPAGKARNDQTGKRNVQVMQDAGIPCKYTTARKWTNIVNGVNLVRDFLAPASGGTRIFVSSKCKWLIDSFQAYAWKENNGVFLDEPEKNTAWEHPMDALRYYFVNRHVPAGVRFYR